MARYKVQGPDGVQHELEGPDGATDEQILAVAQSQFSAPKASLPANDPKTGIVPAAEQAKFTPQQALEYDKGGWDAGATEPEEMRALRHVNEVGMGAGAADLAIGGARGLAGMAANSGKVASVRNALAGWFEKKAAEQAAKAGGAGSSAAKELGSEGVRDYGRMLQEKNIVAPWRSPEKMNQVIQPQLKQAGEQVGMSRALASSRGSSPTVETLTGKINEELSSKYGTGLHAGENGSYTNAIDELTKQNPKDFQDLANVSTDMNAFAKNQNKLMQPSGATTDVANVISHESDAGIKGLLDPAEAAGYDVAKKDFGNLSLADKLTSGGEAKAFANTSSLPVSKFGALSRIVNTVAPHSAVMGLNKKVELILRTKPEAFGEYSKVLSDAVQRGGSALASTMFVLQQQDPQFNDAVKGLNGDVQ